MKRFVLIVSLMLFFAAGVHADTDAILKEMHQRQLIIGGQKQGSPELARRELRDLMKAYAKQENKEQLGKALEWLESQGNGLGFKTDVESLYQGFNRYAGPRSVVPLEMSFVKLAVINEQYGAGKTALKDYADHAGRGYSYVKRIYELSGVFEQNQEPAAKRLSTNLTLLADIMSNYGDKIPVVGAFIAAYGNITSQMFKAVDNLGERLNARNPWLNDATYGSNELTRAYRNQFPGNVWLKPVLGLRDCYVSDDNSPGRVYIFDPKSRHRDRTSGQQLDGAFVPVNMYPPFDAMSVSQTIRELRRRYTMFDNAGVKTPRVRQVLREAGRIVRIEPLLDYASIQAGQGFTVQMVAYYAVDGLPVPRNQDLELVLSQDEGYWGTQTQSMRNGQFLTWPAPEAPGRYEISADLSEAAKSAGWHLHQGKAVKTAYIVGVPTRLSLVPARTTLAVTGRQAVPVSVTLTDENGAGLGGGDLIIEVKPSGQFGLQIPSSYLDPRPVLELSGKELSRAFTIHLLPLETAVVEPGLIHISARYTYGSKRIAAAMAPLRVQEPRIVDDGRIVVKTEKKGKEWTFSVTVSDDMEQKVRVGTITMTALDSGLFKTHRGAEHAIELNLAKPGVATWVPGKAGDQGQRFRLDFSGGAFKDALYKPVSMDWVLTSPADGVDISLFAGAGPVADPPELDLPMDGAEAVELGYLSNLAIELWQQIQEESTSLAPGIPTTTGQGNLFAGGEPPVSSSGRVVPPSVPASSPGSIPTQETGNLFAGVGDGLGVGKSAAKPHSDPKPESMPDSDSGASLFAAADNPVKTKKPVPTKEKETSAPSPNLSSAKAFAASVGLPGLLMAAPGFVQTLEEVLMLHGMPKSDARNSKITKAWLKSGWMIGLFFKNNNAADRLTAVGVQRRTGSGGNKQVKIYQLSFGEIDGRWQKSLEEFYDPSGNGHFWYGYQEVVNREYRHEKTGDGSGPHPTNFKVWYRPTGALMSDSQLDPLTGKEVATKRFDIKSGALVHHLINFSEGGYDMTEWRSCGHMAFHRSVSNGKKTEERSPPCGCEK